MNIKILDIRKSTFTAGATVAFLSLQIDNFIIDGFKIVNSNNGRFLSYPREKGKDDKWYNIVRPIDIIVKQEIENYVLSEYKKWEANRPENENEHTEIN